MISTRTVQAQMENFSGPLPTKMREVKGDPATYPTDGSGLPIRDRANTSILAFNATESCWREEYGAFILAYKAQLVAEGLQLNEWISF